MSYLHTWPTITLEGNTNNDIKMRWIIRLLRMSGYGLPDDAE